MKYLNKTNYVTFLKYILAPSLIAIIFSSVLSTYQTKSNLTEFAIKSGYAPFRNQLATCWYISNNLPQEMAKAAGDYRWLQKIVVNQISDPYTTPSTVYITQGIQNDLKETQNTITKNQNKMNYCFSKLNGYAEITALSLNVNNQYSTEVNYHDKVINTLYQKITLTNQATLKTFPENLDYLLNETIDNHILKNQEFIKYYSSNFVPNQQLKIIALQQDINKENERYLTALNNLFVSEIQRSLHPNIWKTTIKIFFS